MCWRVFTQFLRRVHCQCSGKRRFNLSSSHTKDQKMVLDVTLLSTLHYKVRIKGTVEQSCEWSSALLYTSVLLLLKREPSGHLRLKLPTLLAVNLKPEFSLYTGCSTKAKDPTLLYNFQLSHLEWENTPTASLQKRKTPVQRVSWIWH